METLKEANKSEEKDLALPGDWQCRYYLDVPLPICLEEIR